MKSLKLSLFFYRVALPFLGIVILVTSLLQEDLYSSLKYSKIQDKIQFLDNFLEEYSGKEVLRHSPNSQIITDPKRVVGTQSVKTKDCYVWFETNTKNLANKYLKQRYSWRVVGKPIITARISNVESITKEIINAAPSVPIISGFKTSDALEGKPYHDFKTWAKIAKVARNVSRITNGRPVIIENETALKKRLEKGFTLINYEELLKSISAQQWPEIWFWHAPAGKKGALKSMSYDISRAIMKGIPHARLIEASSAGYATSPNYSVSKRNLKRARSLDINPVSIIYLDDRERNFWKLRHTDQAINAAAGDTVIIYPGFNDIENSLTVINSNYLNACSKTGNK